FKKAFEGAFGDPDKEGTAIRKLEALKQGDKAATTYVADFRRITADISWDEKALMHSFRQGLRWDVKDGMPPRSNPAPTPQPSTSQAPNAFAHAIPVPIHIDAARRGPLSQEEKDRRRREGLCHYCGEKGHMAKD
ncbi:hypothetical protein M407DRAFT_50343, partial [Tulasnella calospora MUT 4182]